MMTVEKSPSLRAHARLMFEEAEAQLTSALVAESWDKPAARMVAGLVMGHVRVLALELRTRMHRRESSAKYLLALRKLSDRGLRLLADGVRDFGR